MKIQIRKRKGEISVRLRAHAERKINLALARFGDQIRSVVVRFARPGTGELEVCTIDVRLQPRVIRGEDVSADPFAAVDHAAQRAARSLLRLLREERRSS